MKIFIFSILYLQVNSFINSYKYKPLIKPIYTSSDFYHIDSLNTIICYDLNCIKIMEIQDEINKKTNNRFTINKNNIYISLYDYYHNYLEEKSKCHIFVYVHDNLNNLDGQYILETKEYEKNNNKNLIYSFYESNKHFHTSFSCYHYNLDNINHSNDLTFNFIYDNNKYLKNINMCDKISYIPTYIYSSELVYKNIFWEKSNKVIYYRNKFIYKYIDEL